jgi:hypothetical protein
MQFFPALHGVQSPPQSVSVSSPLRTLSSHVVAVGEKVGEADGIHVGDAVGASVGAIVGAIVVMFSMQVCTMVMLP